VTTYSNPFTPVFGYEPPILAGRAQLIDAVLMGLGNGSGDPNRITIFTGPRGSGKTVLLTAVATKAEELGWIGVHVAASDLMLEQFVEQIERRAAAFIEQKPKSRVTGVQVSGIGIQREIEAEEKVTWRARMDEYLDMLSMQDVGLLFTVDEISAGYPAMIEFISTFQFFVREKRNVALVMAGLPHEILQMFQDSSISFLRRAFLRTLEPIGYPEVRATMKKTVELSGRQIEAHALDKAAESTQGFPFLIQLVGYHSFNQSSRKVINEEDVDLGISAARHDMESMVLDASFYALSETDKRFLVAMLPDTKESRISDIAARMETSASNASHYKRRLVGQGIIAEAGRGRVVFSLPMMKDMLAERVDTDRETLQ